MSKFNWLVFIFLGVLLLFNVTSATEQFLELDEDFFPPKERELLSQINTVKLTDQDLPQDVSGRKKICCCEFPYTEDEILEKLLQRHVEPSEVIKNAENIEYEAPLEQTNERYQSKSKNTIDADVGRTFFAENNNKKQYIEVLRNLLYSFVEKGYTYYQGCNVIFGIAMLLTVKNDQSWDLEECRANAKDFAYKLLFSKKIHLYDTMKLYLENDAFKKYYNGKIRKLFLKKDGSSLLFDSFVATQILNPLALNMKSKEICVRITNLLFKYGYNINNNIINYFWNKLSKMPFESSMLIEKRINELLGVSN